MKITRILPGLCLLLTMQLSSCVSLITMETARPPLVKVTHDQWKVLVVNRYDATQAANKNERVAEVFKEGAYQAAGGVMGAIFNDSTFVLVNPDVAIPMPAPPASTQLSQSQVRELFNKHKPHLILTLDKFDARMGKDVHTYEDGDGYRTKTADFTLVVASNWSLYDSTGTVLDRATVRQEDYYDSRAVISGLLAIGPAMAKAGPVINRLAVESGYTYWDRFYPQANLLVRQVHQRKPLNDAVFMLQTRQFQQAINALLPLAQDASGKHSVRAAHNLAVAYEAAGDYEQALYWARQAQGKGDKLAANLVALWTDAGMIR
jgi:hypothetical protein